MKDLYGKIPMEEYEAEKLKITEEELAYYPTLRAGAELKIENGRLVVVASCYCTRCEATARVKTSTNIVPREEGETQ